MDFWILLLIAILMVFCLYMSDVMLQLRADVQIVRKKLNILTSSSSSSSSLPPPSSSSTDKK